MEEINIENKNKININRNISPSDRSSGSLISIGDNRFILISGASREKHFNDFWLLEIYKEKEYLWSELTINSLNSSILNQVLTPRFGSAGIYIKSNNCENSEGTIWLHGGQNYFENNHYADMFQIILKKEKDVYQLQSLNNLTKYPYDISSIPSERNSHHFNYFEEKLYIFGGGSNEGFKNDLWYFDLNQLKWRQLEINGLTIPPREMHGSIVYTNKQNESHMYIFGGRLYEEIDKKIYRINLSNLNCELFGELPNRLCSFSCSLFKQFLIIYGGTDGISFLNDIIILNLVTNRWAKSKIQINSDFINFDPNLVGFLGRIGSMMSLDIKNETLVIFGGSSLHKDNNYTFVIGLNDLLDENNLMPI